SCPASGHRRNLARGHAPAGAARLTVRPASPSSPDLYRSTPGCPAASRPARRRTVLKRLSFRTTVSPVRVGLRPCLGAFGDILVPAESSMATSASPFATGRRRGEPMSPTTLPFQDRAAEVE